MRILALCAALSLVSACATTTATAPAANVAAPVTTPATPQPSAEERAAAALAHFLSQAGSGAAPTRAAVEQALGAPDIARQDGAGMALTYRLNSCALVLLFAADEENAMRLSEAHPGSRREGAAAPDLSVCAAEAIARGAPGVS